MEKKVFFYQKEFGIARIRRCLRANPAARHHSGQGETGNERHSETACSGSSVLHATPHTRELAALGYRRLGVVVM